MIKYFLCRVKRGKLLSKEFFVCADSEKTARDSLVSRGYVIASIREDNDEQLQWGANGKSKSPRS